MSSSHDLISSRSFFPARPPARPIGIPTRTHTHTHNALLYLKFLGTFRSQKVKRSRVQDHAAKGVICWACWNAMVPSVEKAWTVPRPSGWVMVRRYWAPES